MDRELAQKHGVTYVHLAAFAIDVDRVRDEVETEALDPMWPFGFEVFLTEAWLVEKLGEGANEALLADACAAVMKKSLAHEGQVFGAQLPFAVFDGVARGELPEKLRQLFAIWKHEPRDLLDDLAELWARAEAERPRLARACLEVELDPPLAPPTREKLEAWAG